MFQRGTEKKNRENGLNDGFHGLLTKTNCYEFPKTSISGREPNIGIAVSTLLSTALPDTREPFLHALKEHHGYLLCNCRAGKPVMKTMMAFSF
jgi:hypothetical protein